LLYQLKDFGGMTARIDIVQHMPEHPVAGNDEGRPAHTALYDSVHQTRLPHSKQPAHIPILIGEQFDRQTVLIAKIGVSHAIVRTYAGHDAFFLLEIGIVITEVNCLTSTAGGVVTGVEVQDHMVGSQHRRQIEHAHIGIGQGKERNRLTFARYRRRGFGF